MLADRFVKASGCPVSRETVERLEAFAARLLAANRTQNLIAKSTEAELFERHLLDGAQLLRYDPRPTARWVDIGSGPGLPGIVLAILHEGPVTLVEPRGLRVAFLESTIAALGLEQCRVVAGKAAAATGDYDVITGRAVAALGKFLDLSHHLSTEKTRWILPKGKKALEELEEARRFWHLQARVEESLTDPDAKIVLVERAKRKRRGRP
ncbi:16S rRNA (guanine(527)-N(7))-methyltransferase RsmG [Sphingomicrobium astaxanthinifaciens]|uniref:16S rRNA (guanine(527)-N(7))-methyltransferase RsmG n=1 Tax=Sphingomicrobium astaxanthinifaciens TaxID=1227949 RepID=UPI001FCC2AD1|nr:16S rRNA (guanine(527)-N(7))-methyltransferase RsmG [Sphingomicrobium astaxanthinifaciens]MCJ7421179.1 16S rRNA (guanine(527)-N(7))-methyltransferase RsmG [Sphingomicrobium astaxanthinifaciens]